ncbi:ComEC/Rec2 family competence protein [uncultured Lutibacter sp.]|uniref:ComEC/Rec2 family competence protein n=1 Tax=uncultured Lutibacter sp. TaxID=437739 RepID=UPI002604F1C5|nr:ComEC/Rec2 family competence protein [uncultured Lutibacter sp.]
MLGILVGKFYNFQPTQLAVVVGFLLLLLGFQYFRAKKLFEPSVVFTILVFLISFFVGISSITYKNQLNKKLHYTNSSEFVANKPLTALLEIQKVLKPTIYFNKYEATVLQLNNNYTIGKILVAVVRDSIENQLEVGNNLVVKTEFMSINKPQNPYGFNYKKHLQNQQIHHQIHLEKSMVLKLQDKRNTLKGVASKFRESINTSLINNGFKDDELAVINALLLGQRNTISSELLESYSGAGAVHILAVSGLHIGIILLLLLFVFKPFYYFKNGKLIATFFIILLLWVYAIIAGLSASVVRAVSMFTALTIGMQLVQRSSVYNTLVISMFFLLLFNPFYLFEVGFQLSYLAVFSIVWIQPKLYDLWKPNYWLPDKIWQLFTVSIAAQLGVLPLSLFYFHQFPGLFFLSNLVIIPFLGMILTAGIIIIILAILDILPQFLGDFYSGIIQLMNRFVEWISNQEYFIIQNISFSLMTMIAIYTFIFITIKWIEKKVFYRFVFVLLSIICIQSIFVFEKHKLQATNELIVFNQSKKSIIGNRVGANLVISSADSLTQSNYAIKPYLIGTGIGGDLQTIKSKNVYKFKNEIILIVDSLGIYEYKTIKPTIIVLQQSPKINLERLLKVIQPKLLIADGSNYKSYVGLWERTCLKNKTPFYSTMQKGAYILK